MKIKALVCEVQVIKILRNINRWLFSLESWKKRLLKIIFDVITAPTAVLIAFTLRLEDFNFLNLPDFYICCTIATVTAVSIFAWRGLYNAFTRHASVEVAITILVGAAGSALALLLTRYLTNIWLPISIPFIYVTILCLIATSMQFIMRALGQSLNQEKKKNVVIYGAGTRGTQLMKALKSNSNYRVCQFIDDNAKLQGRTVAGIPIESFDRATKKFKKFKIDTLLRARTSTSAGTRQRVSDLLIEFSLNVKTIPSLMNLISDITELQDINIEDLLGRDPVQPDAKLMSKTITKKTILVTGAGGSIGSELCRQIVQWEPTDLILLDVSEFSIYTLLNELEARCLGLNINIVPLVGSVQDSKFIRNVMNRFAINTIYHAAAYKHVPLMEINVMQCFSNNVFGTYDVAEKAIEAQVSDFILVSTDKAVNPTNFMGASKRFAEIICQSLANKQTGMRFSIVRFGNVLGSSGSVVPLFKKQIEKRGPITLTHLDITRYFMTIPEAAQLVIQAGAIGTSGEVFVLDMGKPIKILDLAKKMITLSGLKPSMNNQKKSNSDEIQINVVGLRAGEKLYEELSHHANLIGTSHPRIMKTAEDALTFNELKALLSKAHKAISDCNHEKLFQIITSITGGVSGLKESKDAFIIMKDTKRTKMMSSIIQKK